MAGGLGSTPRCRHHELYAVVIHRVKDNVSSININLLKLVENLLFLTRSKWKWLLKQWREVDLESIRKLAELQLKDKSILEIIYLKRGQWFPRCDLDLHASPMSKPKG